MFQGGRELRWLGITNHFPADELLQPKHYDCTVDIHVYFVISFPQLNHSKFSLCFNIEEAYFYDSKTILKIADEDTIIFWSSRLFYPVFQLMLCII